MKAIAIALGVILICAAAARGQESGFFESIPEGSTIMWVGAHGDDDALVAGSFFPNAERRGFRVILVVLTDGSSMGVEGKEYNSELATTRRGEVQSACQIYHAHGCITLDFPQLAHKGGNYTPGMWKETPDQILSRWQVLGVVSILRSLIRAFQPACIITLDPDHGMYWHPEHSAAGRAALEAAKPFSQLQVYAAENMFHSLFPDNLDPGPTTWKIAGEVPCDEEKTCWQRGYEAVRSYRSQGLKVRLDLVPMEERYTFLRQLTFERESVPPRQ